MAELNNPTRDPLCGVLIIDKPTGRSSMAAVAHVRTRTGGRKGPKVGHAGTLDPLATGVLVVAVGKATRSIEAMMVTAKRYVTEIDLSAWTASDDLESPLEPCDVPDPPSRAQIEAALTQFTGTFLQRPPALSAIKVNGRRAYKAARAGEPIDLPLRTVTVHEVVITAYEWPVVTLDVHCAKGFYVRSLARELGGILKTGGHCRSIRRTAVGPFVIENATCLMDLPETIDQANLLSLDYAMELLSGA